ncbi:pyruvate, water dikinase regulatory protein [Emcibacter sp.]|uniref:pyruvate, water dikinase regulatory protein n=1 Tax=Emcibacter sp. TaxID=1979954 RepID=UPI002AA7EB64|nr:pyruvate, water dikinase regulatory protein [Emcibacter sp.]
MKKVTFHLVSDATGDTLEQVAKAALAQFPDIEPVKHHWPMIRTTRHMERIVPEFKENPGLIMFTLVNPEIEEVLVTACKENNWPYISVMQGIIRELGLHLGATSIARPGLQHEMNEAYYDRIDAIHYTLAHDDGQLTEGLKEADIILVGVSRTSKTPTCIYLANRGIKAANVPIVPGCPIPRELEDNKNKFVVGLVNSADRLIQIRRNRLLSLKQNEETTYIDEDAVREEVKMARRLFTKNGWPVIDVTRRSIEETAVAIINLKQKYDADKKDQSIIK